MATLNGNNLGTIQSESSTKESNLFIQPLPYSDSTDSILMDLMGTSRTITITGQKISSTKADLTGFIQTIEGIQNGRQSSGTYVGDFDTSSKNVLIQSFSWTWNEADPQRIKYDLSLVEGTAI